MGLGKVGSSDLTILFCDKKFKNHCSKGHCNITGFGLTPPRYTLTGRPSASPQLNTAHRPHAGQGMNWCSGLTFSMVLYIAAPPPHPICYTHTPDNASCSVPA